MDLDDQGFNFLHTTLVCGAKHEFDRREQREVMSGKLVMKGDVCLQSM